MSSSRRRRNKWLRTPQLGWVYYNPYYELYVLCVEISKDSDSFKGKVMLSGNLEKYKVGETINCGTILSSFNAQERQRCRNKKYAGRRHTRNGRWLGSAAANKFIIESEANTFYKMYEL